MPTWSQIRTEAKTKLAAGDVHAYDNVRRKYLAKLHKHTSKNIILYASAFTQSNKKVTPSLLTVNDEDVQGIMEVVHGLPAIETNLILHSPGGSPEAAEGIVEYLHAQYPKINVIVPQLAMSAATMIACSANTIFMGKHSSLGPIDPQIIIPGANGPSVNAAQDILDQFKKALAEVMKPQGRGWGAMLQMYGPALIIRCENLIEMSEALVADWMEKWMFASIEDAKAKSLQVAKRLSDHSYFKSHGRHISRDRARNFIKLRVDNLEDDPILQDLSLSVFHATTRTFDETRAVKIIENHKGKAFIKIAN